MSFFSPKFDESARIARPSLERRYKSSQLDRRDGYRRYGKRVFDLALALLAAPATITIVAVLAAMIAWHGGRPIYRQQRVGRDGKTYVMWKLRSMVVDADAKLEEHLATNPTARAEWNRSQKLKRDPRITPFGRFLRKSSLDELPQLWNVLRGDMSIVGPRPMMVCQRELYDGVDYYALRPGITGYWQVSSRNESDFHERAAFDTRYNRDLSLRTDLHVIYKTIGVVLRGTGH